MAPALELSPKDVFIENPYWGGDGVKFSWGMAVLPDAEESYEKFGAEGDAEAFGRTVELVAKSLPIEGGVVERARADFAETVDLLYGAALAGGDARGRKCHREVVLAGGCVRQEQTGLGLAGHCYR